MPFREFAATEGLVVHFPFLDQGAAPFLKTAAAPVLVPPQDLMADGRMGFCVCLRPMTSGASITTGTVHPIAGPATGGINLGEILPPGRGQGGCQHTIAVGRGIARGTEETELETLKATGTALRHVGDSGDRTIISGHTRLQPADKGQPGRVIIFIINGFQTVGGGIAAQLVAADLIFTERNYVGVAEEYSRTQPFADHPLDDGGRARRAAAMQQDALPRKVAPSRQLRNKSPFINIPVRHFCNKHNDFS